MKCTNKNLSGGIIMVKGKVRMALLSIRDLRRTQINEMEKLILPLRDNLKIIDEVLQNRADISKLFHHSEQVEKYMKKLSEVEKK
jgi:hypothetical protein